MKVKAKLVALMKVKAKLVELMKVKAKLDIIYSCNLPVHSPMYLQFVSLWNCIPWLNYLKFVIYLLTFEAVLHSVTHVKHFFLKFLQWMCYTVHVYGLVSDGWKTTLWFPCATQGHLPPTHVCCCCSGWFSNDILQAFWAFYSAIYFCQWSQMNKCSHFTVYYFNGSTDIACNHLIQCKCDMPFWFL